MMNIRELKPEDMDKVSGGASGAPGVEQHVRGLAHYYKKKLFTKEDAIAKIYAAVKMLEYNKIVEIVNEVYRS